MSNHTPGPWEVGGQNGHGGVCVTGQNGVRVATAYLNIISSKWEWGEQTLGQDCNKEAVCNARLIASAPDLLEALEGLFADYKALADSGDAGFWRLEDTDIGKAAMNAIAKARGEA